MKSFLKTVLAVILVFFGLGVIISYFSAGMMDDDSPVVTAKSIVHLEMNGVIMNGKKFLKSLEDYRKNDNVKAFVISMNSPGGAVGPSQELYTELKKIRDELKKPVVCVSTSMLASGGYYAAMGCSKLIVAPGTLVGSIGVIMEFADLNKLYDWAKVSRYSIKSGQFKDSGAEYRPMRDDEKQLFQNLIDEVYTQFKTTVMQERKISEEIVAANADGRVFTGAFAVKNGFADGEGFLSDAVKLAASEAGLGEDYNFVEKPKKRFGMSLFGGQEEDTLNMLKQQSLFNTQGVEKVMKSLLRSEFTNQPLYLMPGFWE